ncbi:MAG TPA: STAS domain-containing protein, partial [Polyangia bacterium]
MGVEYIVSRHRASSAPYNAAAAHAGRQGRTKGGPVQFQSRHYGSVAVATPAGRLDHSAAAAFEQALLPLASETQTSGLVLDFGAVDYISSVGLRVLMLAAKAARARKAPIAAVALQPIVAEVFAISRFDSVF